MLLYIVFWLLIFAIVELLALFIYKESSGFEVTKFHLDTDKIMDRDISIVLLTDLHDTDHGNGNDPVIEAIDEINPDFILLAGDMITSYMQPVYNSEATMLFLEKLAAKYKIYYGLGNHEQRYLEDVDKYPGKYDLFKEKVESFGINLLVDDYIDIDQTNCRVYGLNVPLEFYRRFVKKSLPEGFVRDRLGDVDSSKYNILLAHTPDHFEKYSEWQPDLVCSGHIHGGIVRLPFFGGVISPQIKLFPKYDGGKYESGKSVMILSRGLGWHTIPIRIWNKSEIVHIVISNKGI